MVGEVAQVRDGERDNDEDGIEADFNEDVSLLALHERAEVTEAEAEGSGFLGGGMEDRSVEGIEAGLVQQKARDAVNEHEDADRERGVEAEEPLQLVQNFAKNPKAILGHDE